MRKFHALAASVALSFSSIGCDAGSTETSAVQSRDSAGVEIIEIGERRDDIVYRVAEPVYRVGWDGSGRLFETIRRAILFSDGRAAIADFGPREIVVLSTAGEVERIIGGEGQGPEDFGLIWSMTRAQGDTLVVKDNRNARLATVDPEGVIETHPFDPLAFRFWAPTDALGRTLIFTPSGFGNNFDGPWLRMPIMLGEVGAETGDTAGFYDFAERVDEDARPTVRAMGRISSAADSLIVVSREDRSELRILDREGHPIRIIRWSQDPATVNDSILDADEAAWRETWDSYYEPEREAEILANRRARMPEVLPKLGVVKGDRDGRIWVADHAVDRRYSRWWVLDVTGRSLGWVTLPPGFDLEDVSGEFVLGVEHNEFDEEAASLFRLVPPS